jgi:hypothetical protein
MVKWLSKPKTIQIAKTSEMARPLIKKQGSLRHDG